MQLALSLGDAPKKPFCKSMTFCMDWQKYGRNICREDQTIRTNPENRPPIQLNLLPLSSPSMVTEQGAPAALSSSSRIGFSIFRNSKRKRDGFKNTIANSSMISEGGGSSTRDISRSSSHEQEEEEGHHVKNDISKKKLRLTKQQSAFLEDSFKQHNTLNPKQKLSLAKQLNLRPRQVEVWFQNRRARSKLKQTQVDCGYLKRWCETLREENGKLQKELHQLRASKPFYMEPPAATLTMCPSCQKVVPTTFVPPTILSLSTAT
ncbi:homeobox-leucine zipper protein family [Striga asiatica]|uniref:Homeobox-leucine zipper protein family n=1 Tax=Striga asiatica TaxID=4170 RepID=A0A5A7RIR0_STRAF|nr:homeobox-leucine zipper protein family [Striga asiatica]